MDWGDEYDLSSTLKFKKIYDDQLPKHESAKNPEGTQKWLHACDDVVSSMTSSGGDKLVALQRQKMPEIGSAVKKNIDNAPPWLKADSELNDSLDDEIVEKETERSKGKRSVPESRKPTSESSDSKSSSSEDLIIGGDNLPADGHSIWSRMEI